MNSQIASVQNTDPNPMPEGVVEASAGRGALDLLTPTLLAIPAHEVRKVTVMAPHAVAVGRHYARCYSEDRSAFAQNLTPHAWIPEDYDNMELRANALWQADRALKEAINGDAIVTEIAARARQERNKLYMTAQYLWCDDAKGHL